MSENQSLQEITEGGGPFQNVSTMLEKPEKIRSIIGSTSKTKMVSTNSDSDTNHSSQKANTPECSSPMGTYGTKARSQHGMTQLEASPALSHQVQESVKAKRDCGTIQPQTSLNKSSKNTGEVNIFQ